jgi:TPP-dependent pyruvate/acetoin dehydrogenase alpha subunit
MQRCLEAAGLWSDDWKEDLTAQFNREIDDAIAFAESSPTPQAEEALDHVFSFSIREREMERKIWEPQAINDLRHRSEGYGGQDIHRRD